MSRSYYLLQDQIFASSTINKWLEVIKIDITAESYIYIYIYIYKDFRNDYNIIEDT